MILKYTTRDYCGTKYERPSTLILVYYERDGTTCSENSLHLQYSCYTCYTYYTHYGACSENSGFPVIGFSPRKTEREV